VHLKVADLERSMPSGGGVPDFEQDSHCGLLTNPAQLRPIFNYEKRSKEIK
jgi:hypothetical protein